MNCPVCNTILPSGGDTSPNRCLDCGTLLANPSEAPTSAAPTQSKHSYSTPFGKWFAQVQPKGGWGAAYEFAERDLPREKLRPLVDNLFESYGHADSAHLPKFVSFDEDQRRVLFKFGRGQESIPLSAVKIPMSVSNIASVVERLFPVLEQLHLAQLAAFDLHPAAIFVDEKRRTISLLPSIWLASQTRYRPAEVAQMPCVAPELAETDRYAASIRADFYALGALTWFLLTGTHRKSNPQMLPSSHSIELAGWDAFVDGCCRSNPARRFASLGDVRSALNEAQSQSQPLRMSTHHTEMSTQTRSTPNTPPGSRRISRRFALWTAAAAVTAGAAYVSAPYISGILPGLGGTSAFRRGFGDTILKYADRNYDGAAWTELKEAASLGELAIINRDTGSSLTRISGVAGWDDENYWVAGDDRLAGLIYHCRNGHWSLQARLKDIQWPLIRSTGPDSLFVVPTYGYEETPIYELTSSGNVEHGKISGAKSIITIAPDLAYFPYGYDRVAQLAGDRVQVLEVDKHKEAFVHRADNTVLKTYLVSDIRFCRTFAPGRAVGVAVSQSNFEILRIVEFRDGIWYSSQELPRRSALNAAWLFSDGTIPDTLFLVGDDGYVLQQGFDGRRVDLSITDTSASTSLDLISVWGTSREKFWVMDKSGSVWQRDGGRWLNVVRGLYNDDIAFLDAWVSPTGTVVGIMKKQVFRLR